MFAVAAEHRFQQAHLHPPLSPPPLLRLARARVARLAALSALGVEASLQGYPDVGRTVSAEARRDPVRLIRRAVDEAP
ncbi:hypothetical protein BE08_03555 [Sorangium cellulosum]|uniref:Uncharacterized protein n=1 Tax=Sorangium cellulosum TaxID=56 RepID=A0A150PE24_SORCE|nr:hypothetical protein BE08_03555 [Sorangium cellulosum]